MFITDPACLSRIRIFSIPDPGSASKNLSILTQKIVSKLSEIWSGLFITDPDPGSGFRIPDPDFLSITDPDVKKAPAPDPQHWPEQVISNSLESDLMNDGHLLQFLIVKTSVPDPAPPDPHVFGPPGSGSFSHQAKIIRKTLIPTILWLLLDFLSLKNDENVPSKSNEQKNFFV